jgi:hypothetical protein
MCYRPPRYHRACSYTVEGSDPDRLARTLTQSWPQEHELGPKAVAIEELFFLIQETEGFQRKLATYYLKTWRMIVLLSSISEVGHNGVICTESDIIYR